jgi:hypothetical protein
VTTYILLGQLVGFLSFAPHTKYTRDAFSQAMISILTPQLLIFVNAYDSQLDIYTLVVAINLSLCVIGAQVLHLCQTPPRGGRHTFAFLVNAVFALMLIVSVYICAARLQGNDSQYCIGFQEAVLKSQRRRMALTISLFVFCVVLCWLDLIQRWLEPILRMRRKKWSATERMILRQLGVFGATSGTYNYVNQEDLSRAALQTLVARLSVPVGILTFVGSVALLEYEIISKFHRDMSALGFVSSEDQWSFPQILALVTGAIFVASLTGRLLLKFAMDFLSRFLWFRWLSTFVQGTILLIIDRSRRLVDAGYVAGWIRDIRKDLELVSLQVDGRGIF